MIVADATIVPTVKDDKTFSAGAVLGRAFVYDAARQRIACVGEVAVQNSDRVPVVTLGENPLNYGKADVMLDLYQKLIDQARDRLRALP